MKTLDIAKRSTLDVVVERVDVISGSGEHSNQYSIKISKIASENSKSCPFDGASSMRQSNIEHSIFSKTSQFRRKI